MGDPERSKSNLEGEVSKKIEELKEEARRASQDEKRRIGERLREEFERSQDEIRTLIEKDEEIPQEKKEKVIVDTFRLLEGIKEGIVDLSSLPSSNALILKEIASLSFSLNEALDLSSYILPVMFSGSPFVKNGRFTEDFLSLFLKLKEKNPSLAGNILRLISKNRIQLKLPEEEIKNLEEPPTSSSKEDTTSSFEYSQLQALGVIFNRLEEIPWEARIRRVLESSGKKPTQEEINRLKLDILNQLGAKVMNLFKLSRLGNDAFKNGMLDFTQMINDLVGKGYLSQEEARSIIEEVTNLVKTPEKAIRETGKRLTPQELQQRLRDFGVQLSSRSIQLLTALYDVQSFKNFITREGLIDENGAIDFENLRRRVRELFEEIISVVDTRPGLHFNEAFNIYREGALYSELVSQIRILGEMLERDEWGRKIVSVREPRLLRGEESSVSIAGRRLAYLAERRSSFAEAVSEILSMDMSRLLKVSRVFHDIEFIVSEGLGFEELAKYIDYLSSEDIVWLIHINPDIVPAYNLYLRNLTEELAGNNWIIPTNFGEKDVNNLEKAQRLTLFQLLSSRQKGIGEDERLWRRRQLGRAIRLASAIAKGYTGEFWSLLMSSSLFISLKEEEERGKIDHIFTGGHHKGVEKMLATIDWVQPLIRFNVLADIPLLRYLFIPRKIKGISSHDLKYEPWHHEKVYWVKENYEDALVRGPTDEFLLFLKRNKLLGEAVRQPTLSIFKRGGWRVEEYKVFIERKGKKINFDASVRNLTMAGSIPLYYFLTNLSPADIDPETIADPHLRQLVTDIAAGDKKKKDEFKKIVLERYIFQRILRSRPSQALSFEKRLYTPQEETLVRDDLVAELKKRFGEQLPDSLIHEYLLPLFVTGLRQVEDMAFRRRQEQAKSVYLQFGTLPSSFDDFISYEFDEKYLQEFRPQLERFYQEFILSAGKILNYHGRQYNLEEIIPKERFLSYMPQFFSHLRAAINKKRYDISAKDGKRIETTLSRRFTEWQDLGFLQFELTGEDLDLEIFLLSQAGARVAGRAFGDAALVAKTFPSNYTKLFDEVATKIVLEGLGGIQETSQFALKEIVPVLAPMCEALKGYAGAEARDEMAIQVYMLFERLIQGDAETRMLGVGGLIGRLKRSLTDKQCSLIQESYPWLLNRPTHVPTVDQLETLGRTTFHHLGIPFEEKAIAHMEVVPKKIKIFGREFTIYKTKKIEHESRNFNVSQYMKIQGHTLDKKIFDRFIPIGVLVGVLVLIMLIMQARKKNEGK